MCTYRRRPLTVNTRVTLCFHSCLLPVLNITTICSASGPFQNDLLTPGRPTWHPTGFQMKSPLEDLKFTFTFLICMYSFTRYTEHKLKVPLGYSSVPSRVSSLSFSCAPKPRVVRGITVYMLYSLNMPLNQVCHPMKAFEPFSCNTTFDVRLILYTAQQ